MSIEQLIDNVGQGDNIAAGKTFDAVIADKLRTALDAKKIEVASSIGRTSAEVE